MNRRTLVAMSIGFTLAATACHKNPPPAVTPASTTARDPGPPPPVQVTNSNNNPVNTSPNIEKLVADRVAVIAERIHFDYNVADIRPEDTRRLDQKAAMMKQFMALRIRIVGHADERGSDQYNIALGQRRAAAAKAYLVQQGIDGSRIDVSSLGREVPADTGHDEAAWAQNRRDEFEIIAGTPSLRVP